MSQNNNNNNNNNQNDDHEREERMVDKKIKLAMIEQNKAQFQSFEAWARTGEAMSNNAAQVAAMAQGQHPLPNTTPLALLPPTMSTAHPQQSNLLALPAPTTAHSPPRPTNPPTVPSPQPTAQQAPTTAHSPSLSHFPATANVPTAIQGTGQPTGVVAAAGSASMGTPFRLNPEQVYRLHHWVGDDESLHFAYRVLNVFFTKKGAIDLSGGKDLATMGAFLAWMVLEQTNQFEHLVRVGLTFNPDNIVLFSLRGFAQRAKDFTVVDDAGNLLTKQDIVQSLERFVREKYIRYLRRGVRVTAKFFDTQPKQVHLRDGTIVETPPNAEGLYMVMVDDHPDGPGPHLVFLKNLLVNFSAGQGDDPSFPFSSRQITNDANAMSFSV